MRRRREMRERERETNKIKICQVENLQAAPNVALNLA